MGDADAAAAACAELLPGLDEDTLEYVASTALDGDELLPKDELVEFLAPLLVDAEVCADDDAAEALAASLWERLSGGAGSDEPAGDEADAGPKLLAAPKSLKDSAKRYDAAANAAAATRTDLATTNAEIDVSNTEDDAETIKLRNAKLTASLAKMAAAVQAETASVNAELASAAKTAAQLRFADGAANLTSIECRNFSLPNPGGGPNLLEDASFVLAPGHRYALIGRNGKGKSTLLRWLAARRVGGLPVELSIHYVSQEVSLSESDEGTLPVDVVLAADVERGILLAELAELEAASGAKGGSGGGGGGGGGGGEPEPEPEPGALRPMTPRETSEPEGAAAAAAAREARLAKLGGEDRISAVVDRLEQISADSATARATALLVNLGFSDELRSRPMRALSGGWRVRVALAAALFAKPDILLLDEPTNHLSIDAVLWLQRELSLSAAWKERIICVVSHDREFLDSACTDVLHISGHAKRLTQQRGSYTTWAKRRAEQQAAWEKKAKDRADQRAKMHERASVGFRFGGSDMNKQEQLKKQIARSDEEKEKEDEELAALNEDEELPLKLCAGGQLTKNVVQFKDAGYMYPKMSEPLFTGAEFSIDGKSRIVLLGENGNGKTTLVRLLIGELEPTSGEVERDSGARIALVNQHHAEQLDLSLTPLAFLKAEYPGDGSYAHEQKLRSHLSGCGVGAELQGTPGHALSGGQRSRVALSAVSFARPHLLVMDEPTNNLDLEAVAALAECVESFNGGVVIVSHDQYFVGRVAREVWVVENRAVTRMESFAKYLDAKRGKLAARSDAGSQH